MRGKQLTFSTIGGDIVTAYQRGKNYIQPRGYADHPGTGPVGETCRTCRHSVRFRRWWKCDLARAIWTGGRRSDILANAPACKQWQKKWSTNSTRMTETEFLKLIGNIRNPIQREP